MEHTVLRDHLNLKCVKLVSIVLLYHHLWKSAHPHFIALQQEVTSIQSVVMEQFALR